LKFFKIGFEGRSCFEIALIRETLAAREEEKGLSTFENALKWVVLCHLKSGLCSRDLVRRAPLLTGKPL
jgi:hypothetical protein